MQRRRLCSVVIEGATSWREVVVERVVGGMAMVKIGREGGAVRMI